MNKNISTADAVGELLYGLAIGTSITLHKIQAKLPEYEKHSSGAISGTLFRMATKGYLTAVRDGKAYIYTTTAKILDWKAKGRKKPRDHTYTRKHGTTCERLVPADPPSPVQFDDLNVIERIQATKNGLGKLLERIKHIEQLLGINNENDQQF